VIEAVPFYFPIRDMPLDGADLNIIIDCDLECYELQSPSTAMASIIIDLVINCNLSVNFGLVVQQLVLK
jgi:hypothetical protein